MIVRELDFAKEALDLYGDVEEAQKGMDEIEERAKEEYESFEDVPQQMLDAFDGLEETAENAKGTADVLVRSILMVNHGLSFGKGQLYENVDDWRDEEDNDVDDLVGTFTFTIEELSGGDIARIQDEVAESSNLNVNRETGEIEGVPKSGKGKELVVQYSVKHSPDELKDVSHLPGAAFEWLYDEIDRINSFGDANLGNSSLQDRMS